MTKITQQCGVRKAEFGSATSIFRLPHSAFRIRALIFCWSLILGHWDISFADSLWVGTLETPNITVKEVKANLIVYEINGRTNERPVERITKLVVTNEVTLNTAEEAFAGQKWDQAVDGYQRAIRTSARAWVKDYAALRLIEAANKSNRFDAAAAAYILTLLKNPSAAAVLKPAMPDPKSTYLNSAVADVNTALNDPKLTVEQKRALIGFLIELQQARKDNSAEDAAYEQLMRLPGADANDPNARRILVRRKLGTAQRALDSKNYRQAITEIDSNRAIFNDPGLQIEALWILAEARAGLASTDPTSLKDAALAYMRVVALAKDQPGAPKVVESLLKTAAILETLGQRDEAAQLYQQIVSQYPDDPSTARAKDGMQRLKTP